MQSWDKPNYQLAVSRLFAKYWDSYGMSKISPKAVVRKVSDLTFHYTLSEIVVPPWVTMFYTSCLLKLLKFLTWVFWGPTRLKFGSQSMCLYVCVRIGVGVDGWECFELQKVWRSCDTLIAVSYPHSWYWPPAERHNFVTLFLSFFLSRIYNQHIEDWITVKHRNVQIFCAL